MIIDMLHRHPFVRQIAESLRDRCGVEPGDRVLVAVSGGADSVALLRAMAALAGRKEWSLDLHVCHVNHDLRDDADADAAFVRELAEALSLPLHVRDIRPGGAVGNVEQNARRMRYAALAEVAAEVDADRIATAHHADDQLETLLMRIVRGASARGMSGIAWRRRTKGCDATLVRPMLRVTHDEAVALLNEIDQPWREDPTNADVSRWRARLRADVLPVLRDLRPDAAKKATDTADRLREASRVFDAAARRHAARLTTETSDGVVIDRTAARQTPAALLAAVLRRVCLDRGSPSDQLATHTLSPVVEAAVSDNGETRVFDLAGVRIEVTFDAIRITPR